VTASQTDVPPVTDAVKTARGDITRTGTFTPELLDPEPRPDDLARYGIVVKVAELT